MVTTQFPEVTESNFKTLEVAGFKGEFTLIDEDVKDYYTSETTFEKRIYQTFKDEIGITAVFQMSLETKQVVGRQVYQNPIKRYYGHYTLHRSDYSPYYIIDTNPDLTVKVRDDGHTSSVEIGQWKFGKPQLCIPQPSFYMPNRGSLSALGEQNHVHSNFVVMFADIILPTGYNFLGLSLFPINLIPTNFGYKDYQKIYVPEENFAL